MTLTKKSALIILILIIGFIVVRLASIFSIPFFNDEADYIYFALQAMTQKGMGFISLSQGVKPMHTWLMIPFLMLIKDPVLGARLLSLVTGLISMLGLCLLTTELFGKKQIGILSVIIFIFFPYAQIYNSLAVLESTVAVFILFSIYFLIRLIKNPTLVGAYTYGIITGLGLLTKRQAFFNVYLIPLFFVLLPVKIKANSKLLKLVALLVFGVGIALCLQLILRNSEFYERIAWFEGGNIYTKKAWILIPALERLSIFQTNLTNTATFTLSYFTLPFIFLLSYGLLTTKKYVKEMMILFSFFILPILTICIFGRWVGERWLYPTSLPTIPIIALGLYTLATNFSKRKFLEFTRVQRKLLIYALFLLYPSFVIASIIISPLNSTLTANEKAQYFMCPTTYMEKDIYYLKVLAKNEKVLVGTQNELGLVNVLKILLKDDKNITIKGYYPEKNKLPKELSASSSAKVFYATYLGPNDGIKDKQARLVSQVKSPTSPCTYRFYELTNH